MFKKLLLLAALGSALPAFAAYEINFPASTKISVNQRWLNAVSLGEESAQVNQKSDLLLYHDLTESAIFSAEAGTVALPAFDWNGTWMHGYVYLDANNDGSFDPASELMSYTYFAGHNSTSAPAESNCGVSPLPAFIIPSLPKGDYRMRYIVDWDANDPKGRNTTDNDIVTNNGAIVDVILRITAEAPAAQSGNYEINYPANQKITHNEKPIRRLISLTLNSPTTGNQVIPVGQDENLLLFHDRTDYELLATYGEQLSLNMNWTSDKWMNTYLYIDRNGNGIFENIIAPDGKACSGSDLIAFSNFNKMNSAGVTSEAGNVVPLPAFYLPEDLPAGKYRARFKLDWDNIDPKGSETILKDGGAIVDFTLNVAESIAMTDLKLMPLNCLLMTADGQNLRESIVRNSPLTIKAQPTLPGFVGDKIIVRHGSGDSLTDTKLPLADDGSVTIPAEIINSDAITIYALFTEGADSEWTKVWGDEFNSGKMDSKRWSYHPKWGSNTWNRFLAETGKAQKAVNVFEDGYYNAYCIKNDDYNTGADKDKEMVSGGIYSSGKFTFHYGKLEARIKTHPHTGNFPAFWLMPASNEEGGWPLSGEIDIWEQIDAAGQAHGTVHSGWTYKSYGEPGKYSPTSTGQYNYDPAEWHVYAIEWDENEIRWYVDGNHFFTYANQHYSKGSYTENVTWPFYKDFYVILNQSVGNGSWAKNPDMNFTYHTQFDYVRAYKKKGDNNYKSTAKDNGDDPDFYVSLDDSSIEVITDDSLAQGPVMFFDLHGRRVSAPAKGGIYIRKAGNNVSKIVL